jgi:tetratricopeptide (TPR) repeat protein
MNSTKAREIERIHQKTLQEYRMRAREAPEVYNLKLSTALDSLGTFYSDVKEFEKAEKAYTEALQIRRGLFEKNPEYATYLVKTMNNLGIVFNATQRFHQAETVYMEALQLCKSVGKTSDLRADTAMLLLNLGALYSDMRRFTETEHAYLEALQEYRGLAQENPEKYTPDVALTLNNVGSLYLYMQNSRKAEEALIEGLHLTRKLAQENPPAYLPQVAMMLKNVGVLYSTTQQSSQAEHVLTESLNIRRTLAQKNPEVYTPDVALSLNTLGDLYGTMQRFDEAEKAHIEALDLCRAAAKRNPEVYRPVVASTLDTMGKLYVCTRRFHDAETVYSEALEIRRDLAQENPEVHTPDLALNLNNLGNFYTSVKKFDEAEKAYEESLKIFRTLARKNPEVYTPEVAMVLANFGNVYSDTQRSDNAERFYTEALQIRKERAQENPDIHTPHIAMILTNLGNLYSDVEELSQAEEAFSEALRIRERLAQENPEGYGSDVAATLNNLGNLYKKMGNFSEAEKAYRKALQEYTGTPLQFDEARSTYNLFTVTLDDGVLDTSRRILERAILASKEKKYRYAQKGYYEKIYLALLSRDMDTFRVLEALRDPEQLSLSRNGAGTSPDFQDALFIYLQKVDTFPFFFIVEGGTLRKIRCSHQFFSIGEKLIQNLYIQRIAAQVTDNLTFLLEKFEKYSRRWSEILPEEVRSLFRENECIVFSPDSHCIHLPLEALQVEGEPVCLSRTMARATSLNQTSALTGRTPSYTSSLIVANPWPPCKEKKLNYSVASHSKCGISFLEGAQQEAEALEENLPDPAVFVNEEATGERFLAELPNHSIIHFSGHAYMGRILFLCGPFKGFASQFEPEYFSNLRRAERSHEGKRINMMEEWHPVTDLDLFDVKLTDGAVVFLNACETGQHKYAGGGYYQGLPAVFLKNGAHSVISSLVPVFDGNSKEVALHFYDTLLRTHSVAQSLREARTWARNEYKSHIYWIPYTHYGPPL